MPPARWLQGRACSAACWQRLSPGSGLPVGRVGFRGMPGNVVFHCCSLSRPGVSRGQEHLFPRQWRCVRFSAGFV